MNNETFENVAPELVVSIREVIAESIKHTYSTTKVYGVHNRVFDKKETPSTCATCLKVRVAALKNWLVSYEDFLNKKIKTDEKQPPQDIEIAQIAKRVKKGQKKI